MSYRWVLTLAAVVLLLPATVDATPAAGSVDPEHQAEPRGPIRIGSDEEFLLPQSGVRSGLGTAEDPYVIADWEITFDDGPSLFPNDAAVYVRGTTAHFVIRDCVVRLEAEDTRRTVQFHSVGNAVVDGLSVVAPDGQGLQIRQSADVTLRNIDVTGGSFGGVSVSESTNVRLESVRLTQPEDHGVSVSSVDNLRLTDVAVHDAGSGAFAVQDSTDVSLRNLTAIGSGGPGDTSSRGLDVHGGANVSLRGGTFDDNAGPGVSVNDVAGVRLEDIHVRSNMGLGVSIRDAADAEVRAVESSRNKDDGFYISDTPGIRIESAVALGNERTGLMLRGSPGTVIRGGNFSDNADEGIYVVDSDGTRMEGVYVSGNTGLSGGLRAHGQNITLTDSVVVGNDPYGVYWQVEGGELSNNRMADNGDADILLWHLENEIGNNTAKIRRAGDATVPALGVPAFLTLAGVSVVLARRLR